MTNTNIIIHNLISFVHKNQIGSSLLSPAHGRAGASPHTKIWCGGKGDFSFFSFFGPASGPTCLPAGRKNAFGFPRLRLSASGGQAAGGQKGRGFRSVCPQEFLPARRFLVAGGCAVAEGNRTSQKSASGFCSK
jgi:hypothetical protein